MDPFIEAHKTPEQRAVALFLSSGTEDTFTDVFSTMYPKLIRFFAVRGCDRASAEELAEDVLTAVYRNAAGLRRKESFFGWLFHIAQNQLSKHFRRCSHRVDTVCLTELLEVPDLQNVGQTEKAGGFMKRIEALPATEQRMIIMRYVEELSYKEIAQALKLPLGTVKWKIFNAKARLAGLTK